MSNITINIWMIVAVILSLGMIAILVSSIYRSFSRCHTKIDNQSGSLQKIEGHIDNINTEITNIKIDQASIRAFQTIKSEDKAQPTTAPVYLYQQPPTQQCIYPTAQTTPHHVEYSYGQQMQQQEQGRPPQQAPIQTYYEEPKEPRPQRTQPQRPIQTRANGEEGFHYEESKDAGYNLRYGNQQKPETVHRQVPPTIKQNSSQPVLQNEVQKDAQRTQQSKPAPIRNSAPMYNRTRIPSIGFTEFQLPEEYDLEEQTHTPKREPNTEPVLDLRRETRCETRPQKRPEIRIEEMPQPLPVFIPPKEKMAPSKFNSLNDGITRTGKRYSEEELSHRILD